METILMWHKMYKKKNSLIDKRQEICYEWRGAANVEKTVKGHILPKQN